MFLGEGNGNPLQYSCLENAMDGEAWCSLQPMGLQRVGHDFIFPFTLPAEYFSTFSFCLDCFVWGGLSVCWKFVVSPYCRGPLPVGGVRGVACQGFLIREACICVLVGGAGSLLSGVQRSVR